MINEIKKIAKIVDEVITFFMFKYKSGAVVEVKRDSRRASMKFKFFPVDIDEDEFKRLKKRFNSARQPALESYYWQLTGETEEDNEISLVAMMCDSCEMSMEGKTLEMKLTRKLKP